jgi:signal transduction histidine kinase
MKDDTIAPPPYVPHAKAERLVAITRLLMAAFALVAGVLTGMLREPRGSIAVSLLAVWGILAAAVWMRTRSGRRMSVAAGAFLPIFDLLLIASVIVSSGGAVSAFFPLLVLPFFAVSLLYGRRVIVWTGLVGITAYLVVSFATPNRYANPRLFVMRLGFLMIIGASVVRRNEFDSRMRSDALKLAAWPQPAGLDHDDFLRILLAHAADLLRTSRVLLAWEDVDGKKQLALWSSGSMAVLDPLPEGMVAPALADVSFLSRDAGAASPDGLCFDGRAFVAHRGAFLDLGFMQRFAIRSVVSVCLKAETVEGRIFFLDGHDVDSDDLTLAEIVARLLGSALEQTSLLERLRRTTATEERMRLSRDLHDTLLQSLAGLALHAEGARRVMATDAPGAESRLAIVVDQVTDAQRVLRAFVDDLRPESPPRREPLRGRLSRISAAIARQWGGLAVSVVADERLEFPETLATEVCNLVAESLTNAARHAAAGRVVARVTSAGGEVRIEVEDDGRGFPFHGRFELAELVAQKRGPWSLKERVVSLHGAMRIDSSDTGSRIDIRLPVAS